MQRSLETGQRGVPNRRMLHQICQIFAIIWDEADALAATAAQSDPRPILDVRGKSADHVRLANHLAQSVRQLSDAEATFWLRTLEKNRQADI